MASGLKKTAYDAIKPAFAVDSCSPEEAEWRVHELQRCVNDPLYFCSNYYYIRSIDKGTILLPLYQKQSDLVETILKNRFTVCLAARQSGKTTAYIAVALWVCFFMEGKEIIIIANKEQTAIGILKRIKQAYEWIPPEKSWIKPGVKKWSGKQIEFDNGCSITAMASSSDSARSASCYMLLMDEVAFIPVSVATALHESVWPTLSRSQTSKCVLVSTPNGIGGLFYDIWMDATIGRNPTWNAVQIDWWDVPGRDEKWKLEQIRGFGPGGEAKFAQEYGNQFIGSSPTLLDSISLHDLIEEANSAREALPEPAEIWKIKAQNEVYEIKVWKKPKPYRAYILGGDVSEGVGLDSSIAKIFDITNPRKIEEVASFDSNTIPAPIFGYIMSKMARRYNEAFIACERNGVSASAIDAVWRVYEYDNIVDIGSNKYAVGIFSNWSVKLDACLWLKDQMKDPEFSLILREPAGVLEFQRFERVAAKTTVRYEASSGHDDHVMATIWAVYITKPDLIENYYEVNSRSKNSYGGEVILRVSPVLGSGVYAESEEQLDSIWKEQEKKADLEFMSQNKLLPDSENSENPESQEDFYDFVVRDSGNESDDW